MYRLRARQDVGCEEVARRSWQWRRLGMGLEPFRLNLLGGVTLIKQLSHLCRFALPRRGIRGRRH